MSETALTKRIRLRLQKEIGGFWFKVHGGRFQRAGIPDLLGCVEGNFIAIEIKVPERENKVTKLQLATMEEIRSNGGLAFVSVSPQDAVKVVKEYLVSLKEN